MEKARKSRSSEKGFTLIEIIAVLVIIGILAAVAVPKYNSMVQDSADKSMWNALGAGISQVMAVYPQFLENTDPLGAAVTELSKDKYTTLTDYTFKYEKDGTTGIKVTVTGAVTGTKGADNWAKKSAAAVLSKVVDLVAVDKTS